MRTLGFASPEALARAMRPSVLGYWAALHAIDPSTPSRHDLGHAIVASVVANAYRDRKRKPTPFQARDFMAYLDPPLQAEDLSPEQRRRANKSLSEKVLRAFGFDPKKVAREKPRKG